MEAKSPDGTTADFLRGLGTSPTLYPMQFGPLLDRLLMVRMTEPAYAASFLDSRFVISDKERAWVPQPVLARALAGAANLRPLHFIFHIGHAGSTLLTRLLDETGHVLSLREPLPICSLADVQDTLSRPESLVSEAQFNANLQLLLRLWSRGYAPTQAVVLKATSSAARLGPRLMTARPSSRAIYLSLSAEAYMTTLLAAKTSDLRLFAPERIRRLERLLGAPPQPLYSLSLGEIAAMGWLTERLTKQKVLTEIGSRVLPIDFEQFLARTEEVMAAIVGHLQLDPGSTYLETIAQSPSFRSYSKNTKHSYTPEMRAQIMTQSRAVNQPEIRKGLDWLERLGRAHGAVASVLA